MRKSIRIWLVLGLTSLMTLFQNCDKVASNVLFSAAQDSKANDSETENGWFYEGKIFVVMGSVCPDGTQIQSRIVVRSKGRAELNRDKCQDITPVILNSDQFQITSISPEQLLYQSQTFDLWSPSSVGAGYGALPKLTNAVDPTTYGAKGDGVTDNTAAFISALNAGDLLIPPGTYVVKGTVKVPPGRNIQCGSLSSVKIINPVISTSAVHTFQFWSAGGSISNCRLAGADSFNSNGSPTFDVSSQFNILVSVVDYWSAVNQVRIVNNIFENCHGNGCLSLYGAGGFGLSNINVIYNSFQNCGAVGALLDAGTNTRIAYNLAKDCSIAVINDSSTSANLNNLLEYNYLEITHGTGKMFNTGNTGSQEVYLTGGVANGADYSTNIVRFNTVIGNGTPNSIGILTQTQLPAQYSDNGCTNGCGLR